MKSKVYLIGGGLIGLYSAYALTQKGAQAIIIDQSTHHVGILSVRLYFGQRGLGLIVYLSRLAI